MTVIAAKINKKDIEVVADSYWGSGMLQVQDSYKDSKIWAGNGNVLTAMHLGHSAKEAVKVACQLLWAKAPELESDSC